METKLRKIKNIGIAGAGGIGGFFCRLLFEYGVNRNQYPFTDWKVDVYDDDIVDTGNLLHQDFTMEDLGKPKVKIIADKYLINPVNQFMTVKDFCKYDVIISCVDSMNFRWDLYHYGWEHPELFWIDGRCNSRAIGIYTSTIPRKLIEGEISQEKVRKGCLRDVDKANKVSHVTPQIIAGIMLQVFLNWLRQEEDRQKQQVLMI